MYVSAESVQKLYIKTLWSLSSGIGWLFWLLAPEFLLYGSFRKPCSLPSKHAGNLCFAHAGLLTHRHQAVGEIVIVFPAQKDGELDEVYVFEGDSCILCVFRL